MARIRRDVFGEWYHGRMTIYDIPFIPNGYKSAIGSWGLLLLGVAGFIFTVGEFVTAIAECINGSLTLNQCVEQGQMTFLSMISAFEGIKGIGIAHKIVKSSV